MGFMSLDLNQILDKGFAVFFSVFVIWASVWVGKRLLNKDDGVLTIIANRHVEFLGKMEQASNRMADSNERLADSNETMTGDIAKLKRAGHHAVTILTRIAEKLEIYEMVKDPLREIDILVESSNFKDHLREKSSEDYGDSDGRKT